jgi:hypothetical protein
VKGPSGGDQGMRGGAEQLPFPAWPSSFELQDLDSSKRRAPQAPGTRAGVRAPAHAAWNSVRLSQTPGSAAVRPPVAQARAERGHWAWRSIAFSDWLAESTMRRRRRRRRRRNYTPAVARAVRSGCSCACALCLLRWGARKSN